MPRIALSPVRRLRAALAALVLMLAAAPASAHGTEARDAPADGPPRIVLPGDCDVRAGRWIELAWSPADSVSELEILVSDAKPGAPVRCVSPRLDPARAHFLWRVPAGSEGRVLLRVRYNRGGREIEGPPRLVRIASDPNAPLPLALPPAPGGGGERGRDRAASDGTARASTSKRTRIGAPRERAALHHADRAVRSTPSCAVASPPCAPRFVPLRA